MKFSTIGDITTSRDVIEQFGGYNHNLRINDGEFYDENNLCDDAYPMLSSRAKRKEIKRPSFILKWKTTVSGAVAYVSNESTLTTYMEDHSFIEVVLRSDGWYAIKGVSEERLLSLDEIGLTCVGAQLGINWEVWKSSIFTFTAIQSILIRDKTYAIDSNYLYIDWQVPSFSNGFLPTTTNKRWLASMGAYLIIMPDKKYVNTIDLTDYGSIEATFDVPSSPNIEANHVYYYNCDIDGNTYTVNYYSDTAPASPSNGQYWMDTSNHSKNASLKVYNASTSAWVSVLTNYVKIAKTNIALNIKEGDGIKMTGLPTGTTQEPEWYMKEIEGKYTVVQKAVHDADHPENDYITILGYKMSSTVTYVGIHIERKMPDVDFLVEHENRLWGCKYGQVGDNFLNEIYACKLGDFKNWNCFAGTSMDSYTASCGTDGCWTGAVSYNGYPIFFKERYMHRVYGNYPSNFQVQSAEVKGVQKGAGKSLAIVNSVLYYKGVSGVMAYDGSLPSEITTVFGGEYYNGLDSDGRGAVGGECRGKYFISMKSSDGNWYLFRYNTTTGIWHKEKLGDKRVTAMSSKSDDLYIALQDSSNTIILSNFGTVGTAYENKVTWSAETGILGLAIPDRKYISRMLFRVSLEVGSRIRVYIQYDSSGEWEHVATMQSSSLRSFSFPIMPQRCDHFRIKLEGEGNFKLFSVNKTLEQGSDL